MDDVEPKVGKLAGEHNARPEGVGQRITSVKDRDERGETHHIRLFRRLLAMGGCENADIVALSTKLLGEGKQGDGNPVAHRRKAFGEHANPPGARLLRAYILTVYMRVKFGLVQHCDYFLDNLIEMCARKLCHLERSERPSPLGVRTFI